MEMSFYRLCLLRAYMMPVAGAAAILGTSQVLSIFMLSMPGTDGGANYLTSQTMGAGGGPAGAGGDARRASGRRGRR